MMLAGRKQKLCLLRAKKLLLLTSVRYFYYNMYIRVLTEIPIIANLGSQKPWVLLSLLVLKWFSLVVKPLRTRQKWFAAFFINFGTSECFG